MRFEIKALKGECEFASLRLEAADAADAARRARAQGWSVVSVRAESPWPALWRRRGAGRFRLELFAKELIALFDAGLNTVEALELLSRRRPGPQAGDAVPGRLLQVLQEGRTFSQALEQLPETFPPLFVAAVRASERSGDLRETLARYLEYQAQLDRVRQKIVGAALYPALLMGVGTLVAAFMLLYVVPRFAQVYEGIGRELPLFSRLLLQFGAALQQHALLVTVGVLAGFAAAVRLLAKPQVRQWLLTRVLWRLPGLGERSRVHQLGRLYRTTGMLLRSGIPVASALDMSAGLLPLGLRPALRQATEAIREGRPLSAAFERGGLATPLALGLLRVGERSGRIGEMMEHAAALCEDETARWVDRFTRLFEPLLMAAIGLAIGAIVLLLYLPVFELAGSLE